MGKNFNLESSKADENKRYHAHAINAFVADIVKEGEVAEASRDSVDFRDNMVRLKSKLSETQLEIIKNLNQAVLICDD